MKTIEFDFEGQKIAVQANVSEPFKNVINQFSQKISVDPKELDFFVEVAPEKNVNNYMTESNKKEGKMRVVTFKKHKEDKKDIIINDNPKEITIIYEIKNNKKIKIFGSEFVENNSDNCKIIINNITKPITEFIELNDNEIKQKTL